MAIQQEHMRLSEEEIKEGIQRPERLAREAGAFYFTDSLSSDPTIMPAVVSAITTYGWDESFEFFGNLINLCRLGEPHLL
jgi:hypothetical protein